MADPSLDVIFRSIREEFDRRYNITDPDAVDPDIIAFQKAIHALQCPVTALVVHLPNKISFWGGIECDSVSYIRLDLETPGNATWDFLGDFTTEQILSNPSIAKSLLIQEPSSDYLQVLANGQTIGASDRCPDWLMIGIGGDCRHRYERAAITPDSGDSSLALLPVRLSPSWIYFSAMVRVGGGGRWACLWRCKR